jgi:translation initiation factor eIF-2B subunit delta
MTRHFVSHVLNPQVDYLRECRPMSFAMGNGIRHLKAKIRKFDISSSSEEAKKELLQYVDDFVRDRITFAEHVIAQNAAAFVEKGDKVLVFGWHRLVHRALLQALQDGKSYQLHVVDDDDQTGRWMATDMANRGIAVSFSPANLAGLDLIMKRSTKALLGTDGVFADGALYGLSGTADIVLAAQDHRIPVIALCETINVDRERITADSLAYNEIHPDYHAEDAFRLMYDRIDPRHVEVIVTEFESELGNVRPGSILSVLRKQEDPDA